MPHPGRRCSRRDECLRAFKVVLAHEYGHFHNADTAGGGFALAVRRSLQAMAMHLVANRAASSLNPAWWFVRGFGRAFLGISQGASRLQEILADRWAAFAYGSAAFEVGLRHIIERTVRFDAHVAATLDEVVKAKSALSNLYTFTPSALVPPDAMESEIRKALGRRPTPYDSHPCPEEQTHLGARSRVRRPRCADGRRRRGVDPLLESRCRRSADDGESSRAAAGTPGRDHPRRVTHEACTP